jgi:putative membrane protein
MLLTQSFGRARFSMLLAGVLLGACGDDGDTGSDEQAQSADAGDSTATTGSRAGTSGTSRGGSGGTARGGSGGNTASGGRSGAAGQNAAGSGQPARGGSGGRVSGNAGTAANSGGNGGSGGTTQTQDAGTTIPSDQDAGDASRLSLTDAQIAAVLSSVNTAETGAGTFALTRATTPAAREFAQSMVEMHTTAQARQTALFTTLDITVTPSTLSTQLTDESTATMAQLMSLTDTEFDAAYLRSQADAHMEVLMIIDQQLLPNVVADALRAELVLTRTTVAAHLDAARLAAASVQEDTDAGVILPVFP